MRNVLRVQHNHTVANRVSVCQLHGFSLGMRRGFGCDRPFMLRHACAMSCRRDTARTTVQWVQSHGFQARVQGCGYELRQGPCSVLDLRAPNKHAQCRAGVAQQEPECRRFNHMGSKQGFR
jgi:hypothetical protein